MHGDQFADAVHLAAVDDDGSVRAACLLLPRAYPLAPDAQDAWQLRGMATEAAYRGRGLGMQLLAAAIEHVSAMHARLVWCEARVSAVSFYARHGFSVEGEEFLHAETGIPHRYMRRAL
jgi:predicted GNAT family N-acyltransferase